MDLSTKFILDRNVVIYDRETVPVDEPLEGSAGLFEKEHFSILKSRSRTVTITPIMKQILETARASHTVAELANWVSENQGCAYESVYPSVQKFLKRMIKLGVIVREDKLEKNKLAIPDEIEQTMRFGDYHLLSRVARNHKIAMYKCTTTGDDQMIYAIKIALERKPDEAFLREYEILQSLPDHENIRGCLAASVHDEVPYVLLEYVEGEPLSDVAEMVPLAAKYHIAAQIISAIGHLHSHGILHGDIHASNFLVDAQAHVHLIDLGMAYYEHEDEISHGGIPRYMPPERMPDHQFNFSKERGDYISEIFQTGVCLYILFSGNYPFNGLLLKDLAYSIKHTPPSPLTETCLGEPIPKAVADVIFKAMAKGRSDRFTSASAMSEAFLAAVNGG